MKRNIAIGFVAVLVMALAVPMFAQPASPMKVNVPFNFVVENDRFPARNYVIERIANGRLRIHTDDGRVSVSFLVLPKEGNTTHEQAHFIFRRYGDQYFLSKIWAPGQNAGWELLEGKAEQELAKNHTTPVTTAMVAVH